MIDFTVPHDHGMKPRAPDSVNQSEKLSLNWTIIIQNNNHNGPFRCEIVTNGSTYTVTIGVIPHITPAMWQFHTISL